MEITLLNAMAGGDFLGALDNHCALGLRVLDLKDRIWGSRVEDLDETRAVRALEAIRARGLAVHCLSSSLGWTDIEVGEAAWRAHQGAVLDRILRVADILRPRYVRVLAVRDKDSRLEQSGFRKVLAGRPWVNAAYAELLLRIQAAGFLVCVENEAEDCALRTPEDVIDFFLSLNLGAPSRSLTYTWDVQNMWQMGTFPSLATSRKLRPLTRCLHLKGGRADAKGKLIEASSLRQASWPVAEIVLEMTRDRAIDAICLNPSHGHRADGYDDWLTAKDDIAFLREILPTDAV